MYRRTLGRRPSRRRGSHGFTVVEILVVVVIIGILAAFATLRYD